MNTLSLRRTKRNSRLFVSAILLISVLTLFRGTLKEGILQLQNSNFLQKDLLFAEKEQKRVVAEVTENKPVSEKAIAVVAAGQVLAADSGTDGVCGDWEDTGEWRCDERLVDHEGKLVNAKLKDKVKHIYFENIEFRKASPGTDIGLGVNQSFLLKKDDTTGEKPDDDTDPKNIITERFDVCLAEGEEFESLSMVSISQPLLPKVIEEQEISIRPIDGEKDLYAKIDNSWFASLEPSEYLEELCGPSGSKGDSEMRTVDLFGGMPQSRNLGDAVEINAMCSAYAPITTADEFAEPWTVDEGVQATTFKVLMKNTEANEMVGVNDPDKAFIRNKMKKTGLSGIVPTVGGVVSIGGLAFQSTDSLHSLVKLMGSSVANQSTANTLTAPGQTTYDLAKNKDAIDQKSQTTESNTLLTTKGTGTAIESETENIEAAIFGGMFYIPTSLIDKAGNPSMLSYDSTTFDNDRYMCDISKVPNNCPIIGAVSKCSGTAKASVRVKLEDMQLSAMNDTLGWSGTTTFTEDKAPAEQGGEDDAEDIPRTWTLTGDAVQGNTRSPSVLASIKKANVDQLIVYSGKGTTTCGDYAKNRIETGLGSPAKLSEEDIKSIEEQIASPDYVTQSILVTPVKVKYKTWAIFNRDKGVLAAMNFFLPGSVAALFGTDKPDQAVIPIDGTVIRPLLISFKMDRFYTGVNGFAPGTTDSVTIEEQIDSFLGRKEVLIEKFPDWKVACRTDSMGLPEYWLCSEDGLILPKCSANQ